MSAHLLLTVDDASTTGIVNQQRVAASAHPLTLVAGAYEQGREKRGLCRWDYSSGCTKREREREILGPAAATTGMLCRFLAWGPTLYSSYSQNIRHEKLRIDHPSFSLSVSLHPHKSSYAHAHHNFIL